MTNNIFDNKILNGTLQEAYKESKEKEKGHAQQTSDPLTRLLNKLVDAIERQAESLNSLREYVHRQEDWRDAVLPEFAYLLKDEDYIAKARAILNLGDIEEVEEFFDEEEFFDFRKECEAKIEPHLDVLPDFDKVNE